ncbi:MAG: ribose-phosphate pyrophosphokinase [Clostridiales bacterium]|nr:ribose-phosphate pyrophosphokinase [Clostridiales bacterium]
MADIKIYAGRTAKEFAGRMCTYLGARIGDADSFKFSEGNIFVRVNESIRDKDVYIVMHIGREPNDEFVELLFWIDAFKRASANSITAIIPYFGYAKGDKKDEPRVSIRARVCADCIEVAGVDRVIFMDLHSPQVQGFFKVPVDHLYAQPLLAEYIRRQKIVTPNLTVVSPDSGSAKRARHMADELGCPVAIGDKTRYGHTEDAKVLEIIGDVSGRDCLVVDDFSISAGTMVEIASVLRAHGAGKIYGALAHNSMNEVALARLQESEYEWVLTTDTVPCPEAANYDKMRIVSAAPMFAEAVRLLHERAPMSWLFDPRFNHKMLAYSVNMK